MKRFMKILTKRGFGYRKLSEVCIDIDDSCINSFLVEAIETRLKREINEAAIRCGLLSKKTNYVNTNKKAAERLAANKNRP